MNSYGFAAGDPINFHDPFGLCKNAKGESVPCPDKARVAEWMSENASAKSVGACAAYCRRGLEAGGFDSEGRPGHAGDYGPFLLSRGAGEVPLENYSPEMGDIAVFGKNDAHPFGHVQIYDGEQWVSDFKQRGFNPYRDPSSAGEHTVYRFPNSNAPIVTTAEKP
jgi:hypothetical protein